MIRALFPAIRTQQMNASSEEQHIPQFSVKREAVFPTKVFNFPRFRTKNHNSKDVTLRSHREGF